MAFQLTAKWRTRKGSESKPASGKLQEQTPAEKYGMSESD